MDWNQKNSDFVEIIRAGEPANFFAASASYIFLNLLRLLIFFPSSSGSWFFIFERLQLRLQSQGAKKPAPIPDYWLSLATYSFPRKLVR